MDGKNEDEAAGDKEKKTFYLLYQHTYYIYTTFIDTQGEGEW